MTPSRGSSGRAPARSLERPITVAEAEDIHAHLRTVEDGVSQKVDAVQRGLVDKVGGLTIAVFGNPMDQQDNGMVGDIREIRETVNQKLDRLFLAVLAMVATLVAAAVTIALSVH